jgi:fructuronate reductase
LSLVTLDGLPEWVRRPGFDVTRLQPGLLHLGCGVFHRAHQAVFTQRAVEVQGGAQPAPWGIVAASLVRPGTRDALRPQNSLYSVLERGVDNMRAEVIGILREVVFAGDDPAGLLARFRDPAIRIVTLTVTASGYCLDPATGRLHAGHPDIQRDLHAPVPRSAIGLLVGGLAQVRQAGVRPPVVMSCDNLASNGAILRQAAMDYAAMQDDALADWIGRSVQFPCSMVDRIVPASAPCDSIDAVATLGVFDAAPVVTEPFRQWVIEAFDGPRPQWEAAGAEFVPDVAPWAASKLRLLNGTHMAIAYLGALAGLRTVSDVTQDPVFAAYSLRFMLQEQKPTLPPSSHDIAAYARQLLQRWQNPGIVHELDRVGRNGSEKLQARLLASIAENLRAGRPAPCTTLAVAAWICCATGRVGVGQRADIADPLHQRLIDLGIVASDDAERLTASVLALTDVFGDELPRCSAFRSALSRAVAELQGQGPRAAVAALLARDGAAAFPVARRMLANG